MLIGIHSYGLIKSSSSLTYSTQFRPKTCYVICLKKKKRKKTRFAIWFIFHLLEMDVKDPPSNAAKANKNLRN